MKEVLTKARQKCTQDILSSKNAEEILKVLLNYNEFVFSTIKDFSLPYIGNSVLIGVGSISDKKLCPYSDLDLLIVHTDDWNPEKAEELVYSFFDIGFNVTVSTRTVSETVDVAFSSFKTLLTILNPVYICGNKDVYKTLVEMLKENQKIEKVIKESATSLYKDAENRLLKTSSFLQINLKDVPGGNRELSILKAFVSFYEGNDIVSEVKRFLEKNVDRIDVLYACRSLMHSLKKRNYNLFSEELFDELIKYFDNDLKSLSKDIVLFCRDCMITYRVFLSQFIDAEKTFWEELEYDESRFVKIIPSNIYKFIKPNREKLLSKLFSRELHNEIEEFEHLEGYSSGVGFHIYPADHHSVMSVVEFYNLLETDRVEHKVIKDIALRLDKNERENLLLALLFHDIGKGLGGNHAEKGAVLARTALKRYSISANDLDTICHLVKNHMKLYEAMTKKDIEDPKVIDELAGLIDGVSNLDKLMLLTFCDLQATNPKALSPWLLELLKFTYLKVREQIEGNIYYIDSSSIANWTKSNKVKFNKDISDIISTFPKPYLRNRNHQEVYETALLLSDVAKSNSVQISFEPKLASGFAILTIAMPKDKTGIFHVITSVFCDYGASVIYASVRTTKKGLVFDTFRIEGGVVTDVPRRKRMMAKLNEILSSNKIVPTYKKKKSKNVSSKYKLKFEDYGTYTQVEFVCTEQEYLLNDISAIFVELKINLTFAKISTFGKKVVDVFHLNEVGGFPLSATTKKDFELRLRGVF